MAKMQILEMPNDCLRKVFGFLTFHEVAQIRPVCRKFNMVAADLLKGEFCRLEQLVREYRRELKLLLPRRESERRKHNMAGHADVLSAVETRISLLGMTIMRYVDEGYCSFFPGKVLDELRRVYVTIKSSTEPISRSTELLRELRDISSMAMEYFDEVILPQIYESKLNRQQQSLNELAYQRRIRNLHQASLLKNLNQSFPNLLDFNIVASSSSSAFPSSSAPPATPSAASSVNAHSFEICQCHDESCESVSSDVTNDSIIATLTKQMSTLQQTIVSFAATQREMADKVTRLNNMIISLGYRIHRLENKNGNHPQENKEAWTLKRSHAALKDPNHNGEICGPSEAKKCLGVDVNQSASTMSSLSSTSSQSDPSTS